MRRFTLGANLVAIVNKMITVLAWPDECGNPTASAYLEPHIGSLPTAGDDAAFRAGLLFRTGLNR